MLEGREYFWGKDDVMWYATFCIVRSVLRVLMGIEIYVHYILLYVSEALSSSHI